MIETQIDFCEILVALMEKEGIGESELARRSGVSQSTINRITSAATPDARISTLVSLSNYFGLSIEQLIGKEPVPELYKNKKRKYVKIPLLTWDRAADWEVLVQGFLPKDWSYWTSIEKEISENAYALRVENHSMPMPFLYDTILIIDPHFPLSDGDNLIVHNLKDNSTGIKKLFIEGNKRLLLPLAKKVEPLIFTENFKCCGVVVQAIVPLSIK